MSIFEELKRRNVFRVLAAYVVLSWLLLQVGDVLFEALAVPDWALKLLVVLLVLGFIPTLVFAWAYELTPEGVKKESEVDRSASVAHHTGRKLDYVTIGMIVLAIGVLVADRMFIEPRQVPVEAVEQSLAEAPTEVPERSIAVLPFLNLSSDTEQEYFSDGLADTLLHRLAQIEDLRVAARTSSFKFKGQNEDMREIARQLAVATVLEGSVQRQGNRVRITAQLINGSDGSHLWSRVYDDTLDDIFRVQDEIAQSVASALQKTLGGKPLAETEIGGTSNVAAYEAYLKGIESSRRGTPEAASQAIAQLELAVDLDPEYARAWVALSDAYLLPASLGTATWESTVAPRMRAAEKAVALAPRLPEAHLALGRALFFEGDDTERATAAIEKAAELGPNNAECLAALGHLRADQGLLREALRLTERAALINPLDPELQMALAWHKLPLGLQDEALSLVQSVVKNNPDNLELLTQYGRFLEFNQQYVEAARIAHQALESNQGLLSALFSLFFAHLGAGDFEKAEIYLRRVEAISPDRALDDRAEFCLRQGDMDCYFDYAQRYLQIQKDIGVAGSELYEGVLSIYQGDYAGARDLLQSRIGDVTSSSVLASYINATLYLAVAHEKLGDTARRDAMLDQSEQRVRTALANGLWTRLAHYGLLEIAAIRGDAELASEHLAAALDANYAPSSGELEHYVFYEGVREHPTFKAQIERAKAREAEIRSQLAAENL